jgi:uncharacterized integral membrane protein
MKNKKIPDKKTKGFFISYTTVFMVALIAIFVILSGVFVMQNMGTTSVRFLLFDFTVPTIILIAVCIGIGFFLRGSIHVVRKYALKKKKHITIK